MSCENWENMISLFAVRKSGLGSCSSALLEPCLQRAFLPTAALPSPYTSMAPCHLVVVAANLVASSRKPIFGQIWRSNLRVGWIWWMGWQSGAIVGRGIAPKDEESGGDGGRQCRPSSRSRRDGVHVRARPQVSGDGIKSQAGVEEEATATSGRGQLAELLLAIFGRRRKGEAASKLNEPTRDRGRRGVSLAWIERKGWCESTILPSHHHISVGTSSCGGTIPPGTE